MKTERFAICAGLALALLGVDVRQATAVPTISAGTPIPPPPPLASTFVVPVEITGAVQLITWQFDLAFDPAVVQVNVGCDPVTDPFCDFLTGPVTEGPFTQGPFSLFVPGVIDNVAGLLSIVAGAFGDPPPGPSGDG